MDFALTEEQGFIRDTIRKFVAKACDREQIKRMDEEGAFPAELFRKVSDIGLCALTIPEADGGGGPNTLGAVIVTAELAGIYPPLAGTFATHSLCGGKVLADLGTEAQRERYLPGVIDGSSLVTLALLEPDQGYDQSGTRTTARREGERVVLNGAKTFVRLADRAALILVRAALEDGDGTPAFFIVAAGTRGIRIRALETVGFHGMSLCKVGLDAVAVGAEERLGGDADAPTERKKLAGVMSAEHLAVAACGMGIARGAYAYALQYARERVQFGRPIIQFGAIREMLVEMALQARVAELLTCQAASLIDRGRECLPEIIQARLAAAEAARKTSLHGVQIFGGYGYAMEYDAQRYLRDAMVLLSGGGTRQVLGQALGVLWEY
ncbi:MAG: acyl-CoA dehydrogenase family protein [Syntrophales bacterium]|nr:acyl-CoA dehydrogenase family protein [Syntrophales bacterium]HPB69356.1 acyl-CoA dehydrogenase family protein [Syntrophales bacterium]HQP28201.1 acyl-CoA dehydrogenase family protein [Syntrophales bacterium]